MGQCIVKAAKDVDLYAVWSTVVDSPLLWGEREAMQTSNWATQYALTDERFDRADKYGSSARDIGSYNWDAESFIVYEMEGGPFLVPRENLVAWLRSITDEGSHDMSLTHPLPED